MADEVPANPDSAPESGEPSTPNAPETGKKPATPLEEEILRAAQQAIAGLGDLANDVSSGAGMDDPNDLISQAMAEHAAESASSGQKFALPTFDTTLTPAQQRAIELLSDVNLNVKIELGRTRMLVEDVLKLGEGAVVELDKLAGDPVDVYVNDRHVARGEVLVLNDNFCVRISEIIAPINGKEGTPAV